MGESAKIWGRGLILKSPPTHLSIAILAVEEVLLSCLIYYVGHGSLLVFGLVPTVVANPLLSKILVGNKNFTLKRASYVYLYLNTPLTIVLAAAFAARPTTPVLLALVFGSVTITTYVLIMGILATFRANLKRATASAALFYATYICFVASSDGLLATADFLATLLAAYIAYKKMVEIRVSGVNGIELINSFAVSWMDNSSNAFDETCRKLGEKAELKISLHEFLGKNGERIATLVIPYIHPGPAKTMGSGELPTVIQKKLKQYNPLVLHGASDHTLNMASRSDLEDLVQKMVLRLGKNEEPAAPLTKIMLATEISDSISVSSYGVDNNTIVFVSKKESTEDLPRQITETVTEHLDIVDRHNSLCSEETAHYTSEDIEKLGAILKKLAAKNAQNEATIERVGYSNVTIKADDVAPGGVSALVLLGSKKIAIVSIDANNLACGLNQTIEQKIRGMGYDLCEITTTDNHWNSGATRKYPGYYVGGSLTKERLIEAAAKCVAEAEAAAKPALYRKTYMKFQAVVFGDKLGEMYRALSLGRKTLFFGGLLSLLLSLAFLIVI